MRLILAALLLAAAPGFAQDTEPADQTSGGEPMTVDRMAEIVTALDAEAVAQGPMFSLTVEDVPVLIVTDAASNRMRAMTAIRSAASLSAEEVERMMQANFDTALDARYAIAQGRLWSVFIHPLGALEKDELIEGIGQVVNLALTYGTSYSSGLLTFGGGDSNEIQRRALIDELLKRGEDI